MGATLTSPTITALSAGAALVTGAVGVFSNSNGVSFGANGNTITASYTVPAQTAYVFSNSNGLTFGTNGSTVTGSYTVPTVTNSSATISAGTQSGTLSNLVFSNSNGLAFGLSNGTITGSYTVPNVPAQTNQTVGAYGVGNTAGQSSSSTLDARSFSFDGAGAASVGLSGGSVVVSVPVQSAQTQSLIAALYDGANSISTGTVRLSNANGLSFGINGQTVTGSYSQSTAPGGIAVVGGTATSGTVVFSNSNGITFGMNGNTITATVNPGAAAGIAAIQGGTQTATSGTVVFSDSNGISFGMSGSTRITASYTVPTVPAQLSVGFSTAGNTSGDTGFFTGRVAFIGSNNITLSGSSNGGSASITISGPTQSAQTQSNVQGISAGTQVGRTGDILFADSNGISFGMSGSTRVTASYTVPTVPAQISVGVSTGGNTLGDTGVFTGRVVLVGSNNITLSGSSNGGSATYTISGPTIPGQLSVGVSTGGNTLGDTGLFTGRVVFVGSNNITLSGSSNAGSVTYTISGPTQSAQTQSNVQGIIAGTQTGRTGDISFADSNGISFGMSGSTRVTASYTVPTVPAQLSVGVSTGGNTLGDTGLFTGRMVLVGSNNITLSGSSNAGSVTYTISGPTQSNQTLGLYAVSNTVLSTSGTVDARTLSFEGAGIASVGVSNGSVVISVPAGGGAGDGYNIIAAGTQTAATTGSVVFSNSNGVTFGMSNSSVVTASVSNQTEGLYFVGNTTNTSSTTVNPQTLSYSALGAMTMGFTNGAVQVSAPAVSSLSGVGGISISTNGSTVSISGPKIVNFEPIPMMQSGSTTYAPSIGTWYFEPFYLPANLSGGRLNRLMSFNSASSNILRGSSASFATNSSGTRGLTFQYVNTVALYSLGAGTNSTRLESLWSNSFSVGLNQSVSVSNSGGASIRVTNGATISYVCSIDSAGAYTTTTLASSTTILSAATTMNTSAVSDAVSSIANMLSGQFAMPVGFNTTVPPGNYWLAQAYTTASTTAGTSVNATDVYSFANQQAIYGVSSMPWRVWGTTASTTNSQIFPGQGMYSVGSAAPPTTVAFTDIRSIASHLRQYWNVVNSTI